MKPSTFQLCLVASLICLSQTDANPGRIAEVRGSTAKIEGSLFLEGGILYVGSGSTIASEEKATSLKLQRGGSLLVCPTTKISLNANGTELMLGMNTGAIEVDYGTSPARDTLITPDFRIAVTSGGSSGIAIGVNAQGDTCLRSLGTQAMSAVVTELISDASYPIQVNEQVLFRKGQIALAARENNPLCGCPTVEVRRREQSLFPHPLANFAENAPSGGSPADLERPVPPLSMALQINAPFVFNGATAAESDTQILDGPVLATVARPTLRSIPFPAVTPFGLPPAGAALESPKEDDREATRVKPPARAGSKGFFAKIRGFFSHARKP